MNENVVFSAAVEKLYKNLFIYHYVGISII